MKLSGFSRGQFSKFLRRFLGWFIHELTGFERHYTYRHLYIRSESTGELELAPTVSTSHDWHAAVWWESLRRQEGQAGCGG